MAEKVQQDKLGRIQSNSSGSFQKYGFLLVAVKILRGIGLFETNDILKTTSLIHFLFLVRLGSACVFLLMQKPFSAGRKLSKTQWIYVFRHAALGIVLHVVWFYGLMLCGPLRTILVYEHGEPILISMFVGLVSQKGNHARTRGSLMFFLGILCLLVFDNDNVSTEISKHPEGEHTSSISHAINSVISYLGVADHKGGILLLVVALLLKVAYNGYTKRISSLLGGVKRLNALSTLMSVCLLFPWAALLYFTKTKQQSTPSTLSLFLVIMFVFVVDHYGYTIALGKMEPMKVAKLGYIVIALFALFLGFQWSHPAAVAISKMHGDNESRTKEHVISGGVIVSTIFFILATDILSWPAPKSQKGSFIGYSSEGLPLYRFAGDVLHRASKTSFGSLAQGFLKKIFEEKESRRIFYFLCINLSFAFVELAWGIWSNSLGLISDSFHMLFDCTALVLGLVAAVMAKWKPTRVYPYGYGRIEVLSGFVNGLFLLVIAIFLFYEAIQRLIDPPTVNTDKLMFVSVAGFFVNLIGVIVFSQQHQHHHCHDKGHDHGNSNIKGVYLHILADLLGSVGVIVSSFLIGNWQMLIADPLCTLLVASLILGTVWPLLRDSASILSMCATSELEGKVRRAVSNTLALDGVISHRLCHVWQHTDHETIAVINVHVEPYVIEQRIITQVQGIFRSYGINNITVQVEKEAFYQHMSGLSCYPDDKLQSSIDSYQQSFTPPKHQDSNEKNDYTKLV